MLPSKTDLLNRARDLERAGDAKGAAASLERALELDPHDARTWSWLGHLHMDQEMLAAALDAFDSALALDSNLASAHSGRAQVLVTIRRSSDAEESMCRAIAIVPTAPRYVLLGDIQLRLGKDSDAVRSFREALRLEPQNEEAMFNLALILRDDRPDEALAYLRSAVSIDPLYPEAYRELGFELIRSGDLDEAEHMLRTALHLNPEQPWARVYLGNVMWLRGESSQAEEEFRRAIDLSPLWSVPYWLLGTLLEARGEREVARTWFEVATVHDPEDPNAAYHLARCFFVLGRQTDATMWLDRTLELSPTHRRALELRARISKGRR